MVFGLSLAWYRALDAFWNRDGLVASLFAVIISASDVAASSDDEWGSPEPFDASMPAESQRE